MASPVIPPEAAAMDSSPYLAVLSTEIDSETVSNQNVATSSNPQAPQFSIFQHVFARDTDGVMYEAVIRRRLYGQGRKQIQMGMVQSEQEVESLMHKQDETPSWHYFVHFQKWKANWDRWVAQEDVYEINEQTKLYSSRINEAHKALKKEMMKKVTGKKGFQTINGAEFLSLWTIRKAKVDEDMKMNRRGQESQDAESSNTKAKSQADAKASTKRSGTSAWTKASMEQEVESREKCLTRKWKFGNKIVLPFTLKKILVEQWEIITQCHMLPSLPAPVTLRQALNQYLQGKGVSPEETVSAERALNPMEENSLAFSTDRAGDEIGGDGQLGAKEADSAKGSSLPSPKYSKSHTMHETASQAGGSSLGPSSEATREREWLDMADGIAEFFDEALPKRLLYRQEMAQLRVVDSDPDMAVKPYSDIYGCEHVLRLLVRLPELVLDEYDESEARQILAKANDFVRFLHKNQDSLLTQSFRKLNELELNEQQKLFKLEETKRKRALEVSNAVEAKRLKALPPVDMPSSE